MDKINRSKLMKNNELPDVAKEINKKAKTTKITTLDRAVSFRLKRFFSGSLTIDDITGGGYAYRRIHLLFGQKSSGKNAELNQMIAYNQRICRHCHKILPEFWDSDERHSIFLRYVLQVPKCQCSEPEGRIFLIEDYEKSLEIAEPRIVVIRDYSLKETHQEIEEEEYFNLIKERDRLTKLENLNESEKAGIEKIEKQIDAIEVKETEILQKPITDYLVDCGVIIEKLLVADPEDTEEGIEITRDMVKSKGADGIIWDSIQAAIPKYVKAKEADEDTMGKEAKQNALLLRHICSSFAAVDLEDESEAYKPAVFITSQMRSSLGSFHAQDSYSGGNALKHHTSLALELKREQFLTNEGEKAKTSGNDKDVFYGQEIRVRAEKNKLAAPGDLYTYDYYFRKGDKFSVGEIDHVKELFILGTTYNTIEKAGAHYKTLGQDFHGKDALFEFFRNNPEFMGRVYSKIRSRF